MSSGESAPRRTDGKDETAESDALENAVETGDVGTVKRLLRKNVDVISARNRKRNRGLLHVAAKNGHVDVVKVLLNHGINLNEASELFNNFTPVHLAALEGHAEVLSVLLSRGANVDPANEQGTTPLHLASSQNEPECVKLLLDFKAKVNVSGMRDSTPLHYAAGNGFVEIAKMLLRKGADANKAAIKNAHLTPLHLAALQGHVEVVELFLSNEASPDVGNLCHRTALLCAIYNEKIETAEFLFRYQNADVDDLTEEGSDSLLHSASRSGQVKAIGWLLSKGLDVNATGERHETPLHSAAEVGCYRGARALLSAGASVDAADERAHTPLHLAAMWGHTQVMKLLLRAGASVNAGNGVTNTPLHIGAGKGLRTVVKSLLSAGADVNATNVHHLTPLHVAEGECEEILQQHVVKMRARNLFVSESNSLAIRSDDGMTSFQLKCEEEVELMKKQLIGNGVSFFDVLTKSPRQLIMLARDKDIVRVFKSNVYSSMFPLYADDIKKRFIPAVRRAKLLRPCHKFFDIFLKGLPRLEFLFTDEVLMHLSNSDLQLLKYFVKAEKM